jgi:four helix bundle protein
MSLTSFRDLTVWQKSLDLVEQIYTITRQLPKEERYGLSSQLQRAAVSIPSNIAEGSKRTSRADFRQFCKIALGSSAEVETQLIIVHRIYKDVHVRTAMELTMQIQKMLTALEKQLAKKLQTTN